MYLFIYVFYIHSFIHLFIYVLNRAVHENNFFFIWIQFGFRDVAKTKGQFGFRMGS